MLTASARGRPPAFFTSSMTAATPADPPDTTTWPGRVVVRDLHDVARLGFGLGAQRGDQRRRRASGSRPCCRDAPRLPAPSTRRGRACQPHRVGKVERARCHQRAVFAQAVAREAARPRASRAGRRSSARQAAMLVVRMAGCALRVSVRTSAGPLKHSSDSAKPRICVGFREGVVARRGARRPTPGPCRRTGSPGRGRGKRLWPLVASCFSNVTRYSRGCGSCRNPCGTCGHPLVYPGQIEDDRWLAPTVPTEPATGSAAVRGVAALELTSSLRRRERSGRCRCRNRGRRGAEGACCRTACT